MFIFFGIFVHIILLVSIFDIYFKSPIVHGVPPFEPSFNTPTNRLVLIVTDGLRAESFYREKNAPFLKSIAASRGLWGISHTQVPTESRPGHVALIAGFYEDPSAVAKGWKHNPVDFDSVFNQSLNTWSWGAEDILYIFSKGQNDNHIYTDVYHTESQEFSAVSNTSTLDLWVFNKVEEFLMRAKDNNHLMSKLKSPKQVFFLHLLGLDTAGHTHKPNTILFNKNLEDVDNGIAKVEELFENFYNHDGKTTYIVTSDHGMTDWGSHGAGLAHETETPCLVWGAGIAQFINQRDMNYKFGLPRNKMFSINQIDIAPLMSTIIGVPVPVNSVGILPDMVLDITQEDRAKAIYSNAQQLLRQYNTKRELIESNSLSFLYFPYKPLTKEIMSSKIEKVENFLNMELYEESIRVSHDIIQLSLSGLTYYYNYYQLYLLSCMTLTFLGWITLLLTLLLEHRGRNETNTRDTKIFSNMFINNVFSMLAAASIFFIGVQNLPIQFLIYSLLPICLWWRNCASIHVWRTVLSEMYARNAFISITLQVTAYLIGVGALVTSFTHRWTLSIPLIGMAVWPFINGKNKPALNTVHTLWTVSCLVLSIFPHLPVVGKNENIELVLLSGSIWIVLCILLIHYIVKNSLHMHNEMLCVGLTTVLQLIFLTIALINVYAVSTNVKNHWKITFYQKMLSWILSGGSLLTPFITSKIITYRIFAINVSLLTFYLLLSVSHEGLFLTTVMANVYCWYVMETKSSKVQGPNDNRFEDKLVPKSDVIFLSERNLSSSDFRRAFFFLVYIIISFFGTGNIASVNSFEVRWVRCFVTSFQPFIITPLILCKTLVPFLCVTCIFRSINTILKAPAGYLITIVLIFSDLMALHFMFMVKNKGSWLEIGTTISHYVIIQTIILFIAFLYGLAKFFTEFRVQFVIHKLIAVKEKFI